MIRIMRIFTYPYQGPSKEGSQMIRIMDDMD